MTSTGTFLGFGDGEKKSSKVLKPPGGGSSDIFGSVPEETSPRRVKNHNQSQLGSALFGQEAGNTNGGGPSDASGRSNKPGNDSYNRLFGPPEVPPSTPKNHMRSNIPLSGDSSPAKSTCSSSSSSAGGGGGGSAAFFNGHADNGNSAIYNDVTGGTSCITRNPVTGDGIEVTPFRRSARKCRDGNPVTGMGYADQPSSRSSPNAQNGSTNGSDKPANNDVSPASGKTPGRTRVPPGGFSSGLW